MKNSLRFTFLLTVLTIHVANAQVTKLSNNTDLSGLVINNKPFLISDVDQTLWTSDGTPAGTVKFTNKVTLDSNGTAGLLGGKIYFSGIDPVYGSELWVTDGTDAGTSLIKDIEAGPNSSTPDNFFLYNNQLLFFAGTAASGIELWRTDGTANGTLMVKDINAGPDSSWVNTVSFFLNNGTVFFSANDGTNGYELWKTDGTSDGTIMVKDINPGPGNSVGSEFSNFIEFIAVGNRTLFSANDGASGHELWETDGTQGGTMLFKDINPDSLGSTPNSFINFNNKIFFLANTQIEGMELWSTDGTATGTSLVKDINPGIMPSNPFLFNSMIFGNRLVFTATDTASGTELWSTDGTPGGTTILKDIVPGTGPSSAFILPSYSFSNLGLSNFHTPPFNGKAFMLVNTPEEGGELWITDGTAPGTVSVKNINPGDGDGFAGNYFYTQNVLFFVGDDGTTGSEVWRSDGTAANTTLVQDIYVGAESSDPTFNFVYNNHLFFAADDGDNAGNIPDFFSLDENVTLPVTLFNFAATVQQSNAVALQWTTTNEINSSHFDIERSADGIHFSNIDKVNAAGNSGVDKRYEYLDKQPVHLRKPVLFYRLKMVDKDAKYKYSRILAVYFKQTSLQFSISPNPVQNQLNVIVAAGGSKKVALRITDASGKQVYQQALSSSPTINQQNVNVAGWQRGIYYIQLITDNSIKTARFVKQ